MLSWSSLSFECYTAAHTRTLPCSPCPPLQEVLHARTCRITAHPIHTVPPAQAHGMGLGRKKQHEVCNKHTWCMGHHVTRKEGPNTETASALLSD